VIFLPTLKHPIQKVDVVLGRGPQGLLMNIGETECGRGAIRILGFRKNPLDGSSGGAERCGLIEPQDVVVRGFK